MTIETLVSRLAEYLRTSEQQLRCFDQYESQVEGWFKGELIYFLDREKREGRLHDFGREKSAGNEGNGRIDIKLQFDKSSPFSRVELKHWIKTQNNTNWYRNYWYFTTANHPTCVKPDVEKLLKIRGDGAKFMLVLCTDNPGSEDWNSGVQKFNNKFSQNLQCSLNSLTNPDDYPDYFFLGLLHVSEGGRN